MGLGCDDYKHFNNALAIAQKIQEELVKKRSVKIFLGSETITLGERKVDLNHIIDAAPAEHEYNMLLGLIILELNRPGAVNTLTNMTEELEKTLVECNTTVHKARLLDDDLQEKI